MIYARLDELRRLARNIINNAGLSSLLDAGFTPDDSNITIEQTVLGKTGIVLLFNYYIYISNQSV